MEPEVVAGMIERGLTLEQASAEILKEVGKRANATDTRSSSPQRKSSSPRKSSATIGYSAA